MRAYPLDLRQRVVERLPAGAPVNDVARHLGISPSTVQRYRRRALAGCLAPSPIPGRPRRLSPDVTTALTAYLRTHRHTTLAQLQTWLAVTYDLQVSTPTISRTLRRLGYRRVRNRSP